MSFSRPDPSSPNAVSSATFPASRKGFDQGEVRDFLRMVAAELARLQEREKFLERELRVSQRSGANPAVALDEEVVTRMLGEEAARILHTAREAASQIKVRAEESAARVLREATDEAQRLREEAEVEAARRRQDAAADAEAELQMAKQQGRDMVNEARAYRERVLGELARRRELARQQIEQLVHGRDRMLQAFERARVSAVEVMAELTPMAEPSEYVNLSPTTGPVPIMVPASELPPGSGQRVVEPEPVVEPEATVDLDVPIDDIDDIDDIVEEIIDESMDEPVDQADDQVDEPPVDEPEHLAPVVSLFGEPAEPAEPETIEPGPVAAAPVAPASQVDDVFARLRASRTDAVAERAAAAPSAVEPEPAPSPVADMEHEAESVDATQELSVFEPSPEAPVAAIEYEETPFGRRDAELTPLIVTAARKMKRVLADEQNDVLHVLRSAKGAVVLSDLLPVEAEQVQRYAEAISEELRAAAIAGAASMGEGDRKDHARAVAKGSTLAPAVDALGSALIRPLRDRLERVVSAAEGDPDELSMTVRAVYREWKTQRIDEHLDDVARMAFGRGALAAVSAGTPVCWTVDPNGPACPDAEDNALAGAVAAGEPFPTDHVCAPAHEGCRCMLQRTHR